MAVSGGAELGAMVTGPYFTKFAEDRWTASPPPTAVMFKDQEYPSASAALEAYIMQHEGRPRLLAAASAKVRHLVEPVEDLLTPRTLTTKLDTFAGVGAMDELHVQRVRALKQMVDEAYARLETSATPSSYLQLTGDQKTNLTNTAFAESERLLTHLAIDRLSPLPGSSSCVTRSNSVSSVPTDLLLKAGAAGGSGRPARGTYRTMEDYVKEARQVAAQAPPPPQSDLLGRLHAALGQVEGGGAVDVTSPRLRRQGTAGNSARPTPTPTTGGGGGGEDGGRSPPSWLEELGTSSSSRLSPTRPSPARRHSQLRSSYHQAGGHLSVQDIRSSTKNHVSKKVRSDCWTGKERGGQGGEQGAVSGAECASLSTDDLVYASPDGRGLRPARVSSHQQQQRRPPPASTAAVAGGGGGGGEGRPAAAAATARTDSLSSNTENLLLHSSSGRAINPAALISPVGTPGGGGAGRVVNAMRKDFVSKLIDEVDESPSSIITGFLPEGALHSYQSPAAARVVAHPIPSPIRLKKLGLLTPETERLLSNPPLPGPMPGYMPSPALAGHLFSSSRDIDHGCNKDDADLSEDFTDRVRALLLAPPGGSGRGDPPGDASVSPKTDDVLDGDRDWERHPPFKPAAYLPEDDLSYVRKQDAGQDKKDNIVDSFLKECLDETDKKEEEEEGVTLTGGQQPGSMEALKNMLFKVQSMVPYQEEHPPPPAAPPAAATKGDEPGDSLLKEEAAAAEEEALSRTEDIKDVERQETPPVTQSKDEGGEEAPLLSGNSAPVTHTAYEQLMNEDSTFDEQAGASSLHKAMEHLSRLKTLVKDAKD